MIENLLRICYRKPRQTILTISGIWEMRSHCFPIRLAHLCSARPLSIGLGQTGRNCIKNPSGNIILTISEGRTGKDRHFQLDSVDECDFRARDPSDPFSYAFTFRLLLTELGGQPAIGAKRSRSSPYPRRSASLSVLLTVYSTNPQP